MSQTQMEPFFRKTEAQAHKAAEELLRENPELQAVAIVFAWEFEGKLPDGVVVVRDSLNLSANLWSKLADGSYRIVRSFARQLFMLIGSRDAAGDSKETGNG